MGPHTDRRARSSFGLFLLVGVAVFVASAEMAALSADDGTGREAAVLASHEDRKTPPLRITIYPFPDNQLKTTAQRREEHLKDVPISTVVFTEEVIKASDPRDLEDIVAATPSLNFANSADNHRTPNFSIRGVGSAIIGAGVDQPVAVYVDDVFIGNQIGLNTDFFDIERIEVLRGPQGTLYGKNALAGAINIHTRQPDKETAAAFDGGYGNFNLLHAGGSGNAPLVKDKLFGRVAGYYKDRDGVIRNIRGVGDARSLDSWGGRAQFRATPSKTLDITLALDYSKDRPIVTAGGTFDGVLDHEVDIRDPYDEERDIYGASVRVKYRRPDWTLTSITAVRGLSFSSEGSDFNGTNNFLQGQNDNQAQVSQEVRLASPNGRKLRWIAGAFIYADENDTSSFQKLLDLGPIFGVASGHTEISDASLTTQSYAAFGDASWLFTPDFDVTAGLRATYERKAMRYSHRPVSEAAVLATEQTFTGDEEFFDLSPKLVASYRLSETAKVYGSISRGFKSGGFNNVFVNGTGFAFEEETGWNYEVGLKSSWLEERLTVNGAVFFFDWKNQQIQGFNEQFGTVTANATDSTSVGFDLSVGARITDEIGLSGGFSYARTNFNDFPDFPDPVAGNLQQTADVSGNRVPFASQKSFNGVLEYGRPLTGEIGLSGRLEYQFKGAFFFDAKNTLKQPSYGLTNARVALNWRDWELSLWAKNIFNTAYRTFAVNRGAVLGVAASPGDPRTFGLRLSAKL